MWPMATSVKRPTEKRPTKKAPVRPRGRDEIVDAVLDAAERLFAQSGPASVSLRDIAADAHVTYSLINRHFGTKDELLQSLLARYAERWQPRMSQQASMTEAVDALLGTSAAPGAYLRLLAWSLLSPSGSHELGEKATLDEILQLARRGAPDDETAVANTAAALALVFGWRFFHPFIIDALRIPTDDVTALHARIGEMLRTFEPDGTGR
jgi:AcrR family transcriptional regulator